MSVQTVASGCTKLWPSLRKGTIRRNTICCCVLCRKTHLLVDRYKYLRSVGYVVDYARIEYLSIWWKDISVWLIVANGLSLSAGKWPLILYRFCGQNCILMHILKQIIIDNHCFCVVLYFFYFSIVHLYLMAHCHTAGHNLYHSLPHVAALVARNGRNAVASSAGERHQFHASPPGLWAHDSGSTAGPTPSPGLPGGQHW